MSAQHTPEPAAYRVDREFWPAWIKAHPALFADSVQEFVDAHPADAWEVRISRFAYLLRLTAIAKAPGGTA